MSDFRRGIIAAFILCMGTVFAQSHSSIPAGTILSSGSSGIFSTGNVTFGGSSSFMCVNGQGQIVGCAGDSIEGRSAKTPGLTVSQVKRSKHFVPRRTLADSGYLKLAKSINLKSPATDAAEVAQMLFDNEVLVYDYDKVDNYLYHEALKQGTNMRWGWKSMRDEDAEVVSKSSVSWRTFEGMGTVFPSVYARAIPERVLERAAMVLSKIPDAVLMISDFEAVRPDPFLAVTTKRMLEDHKIFIIDQWDEPGFKDEPKPVVIPIAAPIGVQLTFTQGNRSTWTEQ